jgi:hypothetical protein
VRETDASPVAALSMTRTVFIGNFLGLVFDKSDIYLSPPWR